MISFEMPNAERLQAKLRPELVRVPAARLIHDAAVFATEKAGSLATTDTGAIARGFVAEVHDLGARVVNRSPGALAMEFGRGSGRRMPPLAAIRAWAERHGIAAADVFPIARAIARRGIKGRFFLKRARQLLVSEQMPRLIGVAQREIEAEWARP